MKSLIKSLGMLLLMTQFAKSQCNANFIFGMGNGGLVNFTNTSTGTGTNTIYNWNFGEPNSNYNISGLQNPSHQYGSNGIYSVTLTINTNTFGGCTSTIVQTLNVTNSPCNQPINASYVFTLSGGSSTFVSTCTGTTGGATYTWNFGDGNGAATPNTTHVYANGGYYNVKLTVTDGGCLDSMEVPVNICLLQASFAASQGNNGTWTFTSTSTGTIPGMGCNWNFGDGNSGTGTMVTHQYNMNGNYNVMMSLTNVQNYTNCPTWTNSVIAVTSSSCSLNAGLLYTVNPGGVVNFQSSATGTVPGSTYTLDLGDGTVVNATGATHTYSNGGTHTVRFRVFNTPGCEDSVSIGVNVNTIPCIANSNFSLAYSGTPLLWYATPSYPWNFTCAFWSWGDGTTYTSCATFTSHTYSVAGVYNICLTAMTSCGTSSTCSSYNIYRLSSAVELPSMVTLSVVPYSQFITLTRQLENEKEMIGIFPNPVSNILNVHIGKLRESQKSITIELEDLMGRTVLEFRTEINNGNADTTLKTDGLSEGTYLLRIVTSGSAYTRKVLIRK
jgi:PKD repeat protein